MLHRMEETLPATAVHQRVVSRILRKDRRIREIREKPPGRLSGEIGGETFRVTFGALSERGVPVGRLIQSGVEASLQK